jgi:hypothetical protein
VMTVSPTATLQVFGTRLRSVRPVARSSKPNCAPAHDVVRTVHRVRRTAARTFPAALHHRTTPQRTGQSASQHRAARGKKFLRLRAARVVTRFGVSFSSGRTLSESLTGRKRHSERRAFPQIPANSLRPTSLSLPCAD